jgi:hypothetical protein
LVHVLTTEKNPSSMTLYRYDLKITSGVILMIWRRA